MRYDPLLIFSYAFALSFYTQFLSSITSSPSNSPQFPEGDLSHLGAAADSPTKPPDNGATDQRVHSSSIIILCLLQNHLGVSC